MKWLRRIVILLVFMAICLYINKNYVMSMLFDNYMHTTLIDDLDSNKYDIEVVKFNKTNGSITPYFYYERYSSDEYSYHFLKDIEYDLYVCDQKVYLTTITNRDTLLSETTTVETALTPSIQALIDELDLDEYALVSEAFKNSTYSLSTSNKQDNLYSMRVENEEASISSISYVLKNNKITLRGTTQVSFNSDTSREIINIFFNDDLSDRVYKYDTITSDTEVSEEEMIDLIQNIN